MLYNYLIIAIGYTNGSRQEKKMELRVLKYFLMAAREENITRAAERMHVTQPTLSRQLMQLEEELGVELFKRSKHSISLTEDGMLLKQRAQEMVSIEEKIFYDLSHKDDTLTGTVSVGCGETQTVNELFSLAASFREKNPNVAFEVYSGIADDIKLRIENGTVDVGLLTEPVDISKYDFIRMKQKDRWGVIMRDDCPLAEKEYIRPEELEEVPLIMARRESVKNEIANWFGGYYDGLKTAANCDLLYNTIALVKSGIGSAICLEGLGIGEGLCFRPLMPPLETGSVLVWKKHRAISPAVREFIAHVKNA